MSLVFEPLSELGLHEQRLSVGQILNGFACRLVEALDHLQTFSVPVLELVF